MKPIPSVVLFLPLVFIAAWGCRGNESRPTGVAPAPVVVTAAERRTVSRKVKAIGTVESVHIVRIVPRVDGQLLSVHFAEGDRIEEGQLLFRIDPRPFENVVRQREAAWQRHLAELQVAAAEAKRRAELFEQGFVAAEEHEQAQSRVAALRAAVAAERAALEEARLQLSFCSIYAPVTGRAGQLLVHPGNVVRKNETVLATVQQMHPIRVAFAVREAELAAVLAQASRGPLVAEVTPAQDGQPPIPGTVEFIDNTVQRSTGTVLLKASFANSNELLWPGQFLSVELVLETVPNAVVIPRLAVLAGQEGPFVYVLASDDTVRVRPITIAFELPQEVVVRSGVQPDEWVVTEGQIRLIDGARVEAKQWRQGTPSAASPPR